MSEKQLQSVMIASGSRSAASLLGGILPASEFSPVVSCQSACQCRRTLCSQPFDIVIIDAPLSDEFGSDFAIEAASERFVSVVLLVRAELYDHTAAKVEDSGVLTVAKPAPKAEIYRAIKLAAATRCRLRDAERKTVSLNEKMDEIRLVNRAKWALIANLGMSEPDAHRYIEKQAMDTRSTRAEIARGILKTYEYK